MPPHPKWPPSLIATKHGGLTETWTPQGTVNQTPSSTTLLRTVSPHRYEDEISKRTDLEFTFVQLKKVTSRAQGPPSWLTLHHDPPPWSCLHYDPPFFLRWVLSYPRLPLIHHVVKNDLGLLIPLPPPPECWNHECGLLGSALLSWYLDILSLFCLLSVSNFPILY